MVAVGKGVRLMLDFPHAEALADFVMFLRESGQLPEDVGVFEADSLDFSSGTGITRKYTYIVRRDEGETMGRKRLKVMREQTV